MTEGKLHPEELFLANILDPVASNRVFTASFPFSMSAGALMKLRLVMQGSLALLCLVGLFSSVSVYAENPPNQLTRSEALSGWKLLFDGKSTDGWRSYQKEGLSDGWKIVDGTLVRSGNGAGDIITDRKYKYFELSLEYSVSKGGNSGLMFHVTEDQPAPWQSGPEVQIQDNIDGRDPQKSGWLYQMFRPYPQSWAGETETPDATRPPGEWNQLYLRISPQGCEVSMNGVVYYQFRMGDGFWNNLVAKSKFAQYPNFGKAGEGHLCLQDHGDWIAFRNIKIRELGEDGTAPPPIDGRLAVRAVPAFPNLQWEGWKPMDDDGTINRPLRILELTYAKGEPSQLYALDQGGRIFTFENDPNVDQAKQFLDFRDRVSIWSDGPAANEQGLLGLAMHPEFHKNGYFFINYTRPKTHESVVSRLKVDPKNPRVADPKSEEILIEMPQPFQNHNGGAIEFGPDGKLYIAMGDGGARNDPRANGQNRSQLLGTILRIDVDQKTGSLPYGIPPDNPFAHAEGIRPEIFAYGFRNPWRIAFDKKTGLLWCGDVGQDLWEEVNIVQAGGNYGWSVREGRYSFGNRKPGPDAAKAIDPVWAYDHLAGKSITGGRVYRSSRLPKLQGKYLYADYVSGRIWALMHEEGVQEAVLNEELIAGGMPVMAFGEDADGEVYFMIDTNRSQMIYKFEMP
jgi:glucose/arabinose dehydrogenase